ncbi:MAG: DUF2795 domain-containing protein [Armatimonadota bacterium]|jgi:hypothetical protein
MPIKHDFVAKIAAYAEMFDYPCTKRGLLEMADEQQFPDDVLNLLEELPARSYSSENDVIEAVTEIASERTHVG